MAHESAWAGIYYQNLEASPGEMTIYFNMQPPGTANTISPGNVEIMLGNETLPLLSIEKQADTGNAYFLLADTTYSLSAYLSFIKAVGQTLVNDLEEDDAASIGTFGIFLDRTEFTGEKETLLQAIRQTEYNYEGSYLYRSISEALGILQGESAASLMQRCLIVITDGEDSGSSKRAYSGMLEAIRQSHLPIHIICINEEIPENLSKAVENSPGGTCQCISPGDATAENARKAARFILNAPKECLAARVSLNNLDSLAFGRTLTLTVKSGGEAFTDSIPLAQSQISQIQNGISNSLSITGIRIGTKGIFIQFGTDFTGSLDASAFSASIGDFPLHITGLSGSTLSASYKNGQKLPNSHAGNKEPYVYLECSTANGTLKASRKLSPLQALAAKLIKSADSTVPLFLLLAGIGITGLLYCLTHRPKKLQYRLKLTEQGTLHEKSRTFQKQITIGGPGNKADICFPYQEMEDRHCRIYRRGKKLYIKNLSKDKQSATLDGIYLTFPKKLGQNSLLTLENVLFSIHWEIL